MSPFAPHIVSSCAEQEYLQSVLTYLLCFPSACQLSPPCNSKAKDRKLLEWEGRQVCEQAP